MSIENLDCIFRPKSIAVIGASNKLGSAGYRIFRNLIGSGFEGIVFPINPNESSIENLKVYSALHEVKESLDTLSIYLPAEKTEKIIDEIIKKNPRRIILNPGAECEELKNLAISKGIEVIEGCTLLMLRTGSFD